MKKWEIPTVKLLGLESTEYGQQPINEDQLATMCEGYDHLIQDWITGLFKCGLCGGQLTCENFWTHALGLCKKDPS